MRKILSQKISCQIPFEWLYNGLKTERNQHYPQRHVTLFPKKLEFDGLCLEYLLTEKSKAVAKI
jgi:hypothetical protein